MNLYVRVCDLILTEDSIMVMPQQMQLGMSDNYGAASCDKAGLLLNCKQAARQSHQPADFPLSSARSVAACRLQSLIHCC